MSNNIRIKTKPLGGDNYVKVKLEQDFDFLEVLSLKITQEEVYRNFCSDYGVVVGRVTVSSGFGVPNAKVSIFIPLDEVDALNSEIKGLYPYEIITDKDSNGIRYNLLPKTSETDNSCFTPIGTFPSKREVLDNDLISEIYSKYYKFTTTTNHAGDFMIFGVPIGTYVLHIDADLSDIGIISQRPYDNISQGTPIKFFDSPTKYKGGTNLDSLVQVKSVNVGINVQPFWGSKENCEIGITRVDTDLNYKIIPSAIFMGSVFGDQDKESVNKNCRPRKELGEICNQVSGEGTIEMIRETIDGTIEQFDIEGGRVIDKDGTWAYQIPMNLDFMVTDEFGNLTLSDDPNIGLPTRANVRFRIGMDETGGLGRLRTRAKYLVPHNPTKGKPDEIDYEFGENTKPTSFRNLYWNKVYSVNNFISRFQKQNKINTVTTRAITGIKDVDGCVGNKNPFPFNKVNTTLNPLFFIICLIMNIIGIVIWLINLVIIPIINTIITTINLMIKLAKILFRSLKTINDVECITVKCPFDDGKYYAPGCNPNSRGFKRLIAMNNKPTYYPDDGISKTKLVGLDDCVAAVMAEELNIFQFDFYNDWVNGSLYNFLIKYKRRKNSNGKFCDYECDDFQKSSNDCSVNYLLDVCYDDGDNSEKKDYSANIREGLVKKYKDEFYYAASTHDARLKMFATDIINLGSVFKCDWQGVPKIQEYLIPTTYKIPPITEEFLDVDERTIETTGQFKIGNGRSLFFDINCLGLKANYKNCLNIRHICEFGVELDEYRTASNGTPILVDGIISVTDIDSDENGGKLVRDVFYALNKDKNNFSYNFPYQTDFNINSTPTYDFTSYNDNGKDYIDFRGYDLNSSGLFTQPKNSFFFYFGLNPNNTSLDKLNQRFFTKCTSSIEKEFLVLVKTTRTSKNNVNDGTMTFSFVNGSGPFNYSISGSNGYNNNGVSDGSEITILNLAIGEYQIVSTDDLGLNVTKKFTISGPPSLYATAFVSKNATSNLSNDGEITISEIGGGSGLYFYKLLDNNGGVVVPLTNITSSPTFITNLPFNISTNGVVPPLIGYSLIISDSDNNEYVINNLKIDGPLTFNYIVNKVDTTCYNGSDGRITISIVGGQYPYTFTTVGPIIDGELFQSDTSDLVDLPRGTYTTTIIDSDNKTIVTTNTINSINGELSISKPDSSILSNQPSYPDPTYTVPFYVLLGGVNGQPIKIKYNLDNTFDSDGNLVWLTTSKTFTNTSTPLTIEILQYLVSNTIKVKIVTNDEVCDSNEIDINISELM